MKSRSAAVFLACALAIGVLPAAPADAASAAAHPVVSGNRLLDARTNTTFVPKGVNFPSFEYACWQGWGYSGNTVGQAALMATWKINTARIPLNEDCWLGLNGSPAGSGRTAEGYRVAVETFVGQLNAAGIVAILDLHSSAPLGYLAHGQRAMADTQSLAFWTSVAARFKANPSVMFELFNEPYSRGSFSLTWACWRDGGCQAPVEDDYTATLSGATYSVVGMSALVTAVRATGAAQPLLLGGLNYSNDLTGWLAYRPADSQLVAAWHNYPGQGCNTSCWNSTVTDVAAVVPIVTTEFGQTDGGNSYLTTFMDWADAHGVGYLPWAWWRVTEAESHVNSLYALIDANDQPKYPAGTALYAQLSKVTSPPALEVQRVSGADRYATAVEVSKMAFPGTAPVVYIATGTNYPDALSAGPAASKQGGPLLLTDPNVLPAVVTAELMRLHPSTIVIVGGTASVSAAVESTLRSIATTVRVPGADRYATSRAIVNYAFPAGAPVAYVATGRNFPDALSAGAAAGHAGGPVVLVDGMATSVPVETKNLLTNLHAAKTVVAGGVASVSPSVQSALGATRIAGDDRFATSVALADDAWDTSTTVILATGLNFPDALAASAWAGRIGAPLVAVHSDCVPASALELITRLHATKVFVVGGEAVLNSNVFALRGC